METLETETIVIGAGVVGLACAARLAAAGQEVLVLERNTRFGEETSARNSEVIHAGIYYRPGSLKAKLCVRGKALLYHHCRERGIVHQQTGKLIVAAEDQDKPVVLGLIDNARQNGVNDLGWLDRDEMIDLEPHLSGVGALHSPSTGIVDSHSLMLTMLGDLEDRGGMVSYRSTVGSLCSSGNAFRLEVDTGDQILTIKSRRLVNCAGQQAVQLAASDCGLTKSSLPRPFYSKGNYFKLTVNAPFERLIYPAPVPGGLGVHLTRDTAGNVRFGPDVEPVESPQAGLAVDQGRADAFYRSIRRYWPGLPDDSLQADYAGIRPKIYWQDDATEFGADFAVLGPAHHEVEHLVHCFGIESPGLTASLAIAELVAELS